MLLSLAAIYARHLKIEIMFSLYVCLSALDVITYWLVFFSSSEIGVALKSYSSLSEKYISRLLANASFYSYETSQRFRYLTYSKGKNNFFSVDGLDESKSKRACSISVIK
jgi:hypothetical protein